MENTQYCITEDQEEEAPKEVVRVTWENPTAVNLLVTLYKVLLSVVPPLLTCYEVHMAA